MTAMDDGGDFDGWLRGQLSLTLGPQRGPRPDPAQARYAMASRSAAVRRAPAARSGARALLASGAAAALAAGGAAAAAATGTANPVSWGRDVVQVVQQCKDARGTQAGSSRGIGACVSQAAGHHGASRRAPATPGSAAMGSIPSPSPTLPGKRVGQQPGAQPAANGSGSGNAGGNGNGNAGSGAGAARGHGQSQPSGAGHGSQSRPVSSPKG
jgi:hypothetical protein